MHKHTNNIELLAPAGTPEAGYAALHYGADAVYLGVKQFSARADAENFSLEELSDFVGYAHSLTPYRRVYVTLNTLLKDIEIPEVLRLLQYFRQIKIDALIIQDAALIYLVKTYFPELAIHASTQMALHNVAGVEAARSCGFERVVLARELSANEIEKIAQTIPDMELEIFIHGALCYAYSGLCLLSSMLRGRSGNRGSCAYNCRNHYCPSNSQSSNLAGYAMSMKDLALEEQILLLKKCRIASLKIEGRKKSPAYVAAAVRYYRAILDGASSQKIEQRRLELQTIFSRPQTHFFFDNAVQNVVESTVVGHMGAKIGRVEAYIAGKGKLPDVIRFRPDIDLKVYDGLLLPIPDHFGKPFGFSAEKIMPVSAKGFASRPVFECEAGTLIDVVLPEKHPRIETGISVYCASSQAVKQELDHYCVPKPGMHKMRQDVHLTVKLNQNQIAVSGRCNHLTVSFSENVELSPAKNPENATKTFEQNFRKSGDSSFNIVDCCILNPQALFAPTSMINQWRRQILQLLADKLAEESEKEIVQILTKEKENSTYTPKENYAQMGAVLKVDSPNLLAKFTSDQFKQMSEIVFDITRIATEEFNVFLTEYMPKIGDKLRLALPVISREYEHKALQEKIQMAISQFNVQKWMISNLAGFAYLPQNCDIGGDFSLNVMNSFAAKFYLKMKKCSFITISPEASQFEISDIVQKFPKQTRLMVFQHTPLAYSQSCIYANLNHGCVGKNKCTFDTMPIMSNKGEELMAVNHHCRSVLLNNMPFHLLPYRSLLCRLGVQTIVTDFCWYPFDLEKVSTLWETLVSPKGSLPTGTCGNFIQSLP